MTQAGRTVQARAGWAVLACACAAALAGAPGARADEARAVTVRGSISDETGAPIPGNAVRLLKSRKILNLGGHKSSDQSIEEVRAATDEHGFFEFQVPVDADFPYYYLRFYDPQTFDAIKYRLPEDRDVSRQVRKGRTVQAAVILKTDERWPQVKALLDHVGPGSQVGQVLRSLGLPSSRAAQGDGRELWTYGTAGVAYLVAGAKVLETRTFAPSSAAASAANAPAGGAGADEPVPATRVDEP